MALRYLVRAGVIIGTVHYTKKIGVWGNSEEAEQLYKGITNGLRPRVHSLEEHLPFNMPALPQSGQVRYLARHYYNEGVKSTFQFIELLPTNTREMLVKAKDAFIDFSKSPPPPSTSAISTSTPKEL